MLALRYIGGELRITQDIDKRFIMLYREKGRVSRALARLSHPGTIHAAPGWTRKGMADQTQLVNYAGVTADQENGSVRPPNRATSISKWDCIEI